MMEKKKEKDSEGARENSFVSLFFLLKVKKIPEAADLIKNIVEIRSWRSFNECHARKKNSAMDLAY